MRSTLGVCIVIWGCLFLAVGVGCVHSIRNFSNICVTVKDFDKMVKFYCDALGFNRSFGGEAFGKNYSRAIGLEGADAKWIYLTHKSSSNPFSLVIAQYITPVGKPVIPRPGMNDFYLSHIGFMVDNVDQLYHDLRGDPWYVKFNTAPLILNTGAKVVFGRDPEGNMMEFVQLLK